MAADDPLAAWHVDASAYPATGSVADRLRFLVRYAILAPSGHNTQPWLFRVAHDHLDLFADRTRGLPVVDPHDRALVISCGAALGTMRAAGRRFGHALDIECLPAGDAPDLLARVRLGAPHAPTEADVARFEAIRKRRSTRTAYEDEPLPAGLAERLRTLARADDVELVMVTGDAKAAVAALVASGDRAQFADPAFRRELGSWVHSRRAASRDGMSGSAFGMPDVLSGVGGLAIRTFDMGNGIGARDEQIATGSPALLLVATEGDEPRDWLAAGIGHAAVLLEATAAGLTAAYLNQPVEVGTLRPRLREAAGANGVPQLLMRIGRAPSIGPAVRRPVEAVLLP